MNIIRNFDIIGEAPSFNYKGNKRFHTCISYTLSVLIFLLCLAGLCYFGSEIVIKDKPTIISGSSYRSNPQRLNLTPEVFPFFLAVEDPTNNLKYFKDDRIYKMKAHIYNRNVTYDSNTNPIVKVVKTPLKLVDCDLNHFPGVEATFNHTDFKGAYCISREESVFLKGDFTNDQFYEIQMRIFPCDNSTMNNTCKSQSEINAKLASSYIDFHYVTYFYSPEEYLSPVKKERQNYFTTISNNGQKVVSAYLKKTNYTTDSGYLMQDEDTKYYTQLDYFRELSNPAQISKTDYIFNLDIRLSFSEDKYLRSYMKVQALLAIMGGLFNMLTKMSTYLYSFLFSYLFYIDLINVNFRIDSDNSKRDNPRSKLNQINIPSSSISKITNSTNNNKIQLFRKKISLPPPEENKFLHLKSDKKFTVSSVSYIKNFYLCCLYDKSSIHSRELYNTGKSTLEDYFDTVNLVQRQMDIEKLKYILLTESELNVFNFLPKPNISSLLKDKAKSDTFFSIKKKPDFETFYLSYEKYKSESNNKRLANLLQDT